MKNKANIFWCTGMSGSGKSTLAEHARVVLKNHGFTALILDGDAIREKYDVKLGFGREDVEKNNLNVARICENERLHYDAIIVPIISPIDIVRCRVRRILSPGYNLIYVSADMESLKERDPKGLYKAADSGKITDLIGYSRNAPYDKPTDVDLLIDAGNHTDVELSKKLFSKFVLLKMIGSSVLL